MGKFNEQTIEQAAEQDTDIPESERGALYDDDWVLTQLMHPNEAVVNINHIEGLEIHVTALLERIRYYGDLSPYSNIIEALEGIQAELKLIRAGSRP